MPAESWPDRGILGSLRRFVDVEVEDHLRTNKAVRRRPNPFLARILGLVLKPSMLWLVIWLNLLAVIIPIGATDAYEAIPLWLRPSPTMTVELREDLRNTNAYFLALQVALIALIFPIAIGLVSLLVQRSHASSSNAHIGIYYDEARAWTVGASGIAFVGVLSFQLLTQVSTGLPIKPLTMNFGTELLARELGLTFLNFAWLICNLAGIWHFLGVSLQFVDPAGRERIRERFTVRRSMPQHLRIDLFLAVYLGSGRMLLPESEEDDGPTVLFGSSGKIVGDVEIRKRVRQNQVLTDVWGRPLRLVLSRWWRDSQVEVSGDRFAGLAPSAALGFPAMPSALVSGPVAICRRRGGVEFSAIERWIIQSCFRFGKSGLQELPSPKAILEELADEALGHMERIAVIGFDDALSAMAKYHQFLVDVHAASDHVGKPGSFAEIGGVWEPPHGEWVATYFRIIERAVKLLDREERFVRTVGYLPRWLLPDDLTRATPGIVARLLDLTRAVVVRLEDWVADRALRAEQEPSIAPAELNLSALDSRRYATTLRSVVGAWESVLSLTSSYFRWEEAPQNPAAEWDRLRVAWPFLWHHLRATAYFVAISVWNGDREGVEQYVDCLLRWPDRLEHDLQRDYLIERQFLSSDVLEMEWSRVEADLASLRSVDLYVLEPQNVFAGILENAWRDVIWVLAGLILGWLADGKISQPLTRLALERLRAGEPVYDQGFYGRPLRGRQEDEFERLFRSLIRMELSGDPWSDQGYAAYVNGLVQFLDLMSERDVVPGRVFRPTTRHDLRDLQVAFTALLLLAMNGQATEWTDNKIMTLLDEIETYYGDGGISALYSYLDRLSSDLTEEAVMSYIATILSTRMERADFEERCKAVLDYAQSQMRQIAQRRDDRIKLAVIDARQISRIERSVEKALLNDQGGIDILDGFPIRRTKEGIKETELFRLTNVNKGYLVSPQMANEPSNMVEHMAKLVRQRAADLAWRKALREPQRHQLEASTEQEYFETFLNAAERLRSAGLRPVLLVCSPTEPLWLESWRRGSDQARPAGMQVERQRRSEVGGSGYIMTINGVQVFRATLDVGTSLLFPRELISEVVYGEDEGGRIVHATFKQSEGSSDPWIGYIEFSFRQSVRLHDRAEVLELAYPAEMGYGEAPG